MGFTSDVEEGAVRAREGGRESRQPPPPTPLRFVASGRFNDTGQSAIDNREAIMDRGYPAGTRIESGATRYVRGSDAW